LGLERHQLDIENEGDDRTTSQDIGHASIDPEKADFNKVQQSETSIFNKLFKKLAQHEKDRERENAVASDEETLPEVENDPNEESPEEPQTPPRSQAQMIQLRGDDHEEEQIRVLEINAEREAASRRTIKFSKPWTPPLSSKRVRRLSTFKRLKAKKFILKNKSLTQQ